MKIERGSKGELSNLISKQLLNVIIFLLIFLFCGGGFLFWLTRRKRFKKHTEDVLKHLEELEEREEAVSLESLSRALSLSMHRTLALVQNMVDGGLIQTANGNFRLTKEGRQKAVQLVRAHRLWERYLADEARMDLKDLHTEADRREHGMSSALTDALEAHLGYPKRDPHGDPIPSAEGKIPKEFNLPLSKWPLDQPCEIVHIEDEPPHLFARIAREGLIPGMAIEILKRNEREILVWDGDNKHKLTPEVCENIFVSHPSKKPRKVTAVPLSALTPGESGKVVALECQGLTRRRFLDLGLLPGTPIEVLMSSALGRPYAYRLRETVIAIRTEQAQQILVEPMRSKEGGFTTER